MSNAVSSEQYCSTCGAVIPPAAFEGQCVNCLLQLAIKADSGSEPRPTEPLVPVQYFGDFELIQEIARGGMGVVWKARQVSLNRPVALKLLVEGRFASEAAIRRFEFEAEAAANLDHPNIVPIYEIGHHESWPYLAMKLIEGGSLADRMTDFALVRPQDFRAGSMTKPNPFEAAKTCTCDRLRGIVRLVSTVAQAVHFAHQRGILHRDLKPSNILMDPLGEPHVTDFGLAKVVGTDGRLTLTGALLGSPNYMAPEQAAGKSAQLSIAADIYSLGVILFELLTGRVPFRGETPVATLKMVIESEPPRLRSFNPAVNPDIETICLKCLEKDPSQRYPSAEALAEDLERWSQNRPITARRSSPVEIVFKWIRREPLKAGGILAIFLTALMSSYITGRISMSRLPHMAMEHTVETANEKGEFLLRVIAAKDNGEHRVTMNFWRYGFDPPQGMAVRLDFLGVPADLLPSLRCLIRADQPGRPDPPRSGVVTNGQTFVLKSDPDIDRNFYVAAVGWPASDLLTVASNAVIRLTLVTNKTVHTTAPITALP